MRKEGLTLCFVLFWTPVFQCTLLQSQVVICGLVAQDCLQLQCRYTESADCILEWLHIKFIKSKKSAISVRLKQQIFCFCKYIFLLRNNITCKLIMWRIVIEELLVKYPHECRASVWHTCNPVDNFFPRAPTQPSSWARPTWSVPRCSLRTVSETSSMWPHWLASTRTTRTWRGGSPPEPPRGCLRVEQTCPLWQQHTISGPKLRAVLSCKHRYTLLRTAWTICSQISVGWTSFENEAGVTIWCYGWKCAKLTLWRHLTSRILWLPICYHLQTQKAAEKCISKYISINTSLVFLVIVKETSSLSCFRSFPLAILIQNPGSTGHTQVCVIVYSMR